MGRPYRLLFEHVLAKRDPEEIHAAAFRAIRAAAPLTASYPASSHKLTGKLRRADAGGQLTAMGIAFPNRLGLAAGFDKNAIGIDALAALGFGHVEIGTVTAEPQPGNPKPRLFRLVSDRAIVNRMGFNNDGAEVVATRLAERAVKMRRLGADSASRWARSAGWGPVLGVNIGKTKVVPEDDQAAVEADYGKSTRLLAPFADYLVVNVSSPNTPGLRSLQAVERLEPLLAHVRRTADAGTDERVPLLVKIAPDLADEDVLAVADLALAIGLDGIIATNTTISREGLRSHPSEIAAAGAGGLSGRPLGPRALEVMRLLKARVGDRLTLIGVGGITTAQDAQARLDAGADLVQGYTAFVYEGPLWPRTIAAAIDRQSAGGLS